MNIRDDKQFGHQISFEEYAANRYPSDFCSLIAASPTAEIQACFSKAREVLLDPKYRSIAVSVSGGADSDRVCDILLRFDIKEKLKLYMVNTGMEYRATFEHLHDIERKYGVKVNIISPERPVQAICRDFGYPFISKQVSQNINRLQKHGFQWETGDLRSLIKRYPNCKKALRWWCNDFGERSRFSISYNKGLKEFLIANPPEIPISDECCIKVKEKTLVKASEGFDLKVVGLRKAEGGRRAALQSCFEDHSSDGQDVFRPIFWLKKQDCEAYDSVFGCEHCSTYDWGLDRLGCACCPFGRHFEKELELAKVHDPNLYRRAIAVFGPSYEYTRRYKTSLRKELNGR